VESARISLSKQNPLNLALDTCIELIDDIDTINNVVPELASIVKVGVGLNSVSASCKILTNLATKPYLRSILRKHSKKVMNALMAQIACTSSPHLKATYSSVIGHWCSLSKRKYVDTLMSTVETMYFNVGGKAEKRVMAGMVAYNVSRFSLRSIKRYDKILALCFVAVHDSNEESASFWIKAMDECGGKKMCLLNNMEVTLEVVLRTLDDGVYQQKLTAIASIKEMAELFGDDMDGPLLSKLVQRILEMLPGRIWDGKTKLFEALSHITKHCAPLINKDGDLRSLVVSKMLIEMERKKIEYRIAAINAFGEMVVNLNRDSGSRADARGQLVLMDEIVPICRGVFEEFNAKQRASMAESTTDHSEKMENKAKYRKEKELLCCTMKCLGSLWNGEESVQRKYVEFVVERAFVFYLKRTDWMVQIAIFKAIQAFCTRLRVEVLDEKRMGILIGAIMEGFNDLKYAAVRHQALSSLHEVLKLVKAAKKETDLVGEKLMTAIKKKVDDIVNHDQKPIVVQQASKLRNDIFYR